MKTFKLTGFNLTIEDVYEIASAKSNELSFVIDSESEKKILESKKLVLEITKKGQPVYGINTGFGALASKLINEADLKELQYNLIRSHCTGVGKPFSREIVRAIMICRVNCLIQGYSGIDHKIIQLILKFLECDIIPFVPEKGSVGASGDLAPLAHIALSLIGEGSVLKNNEKIPTNKALSEAGLNPIVLGPKDGLALINGTSVMLALGCLSVFESDILMKTADIAGALTLDAVRGTPKAFDHRISLLKPHAGQIAVAKNLNILISQSEIIHSHPEDGKVQDPYSLRCMPQVHGACRQTLKHAREVIDTELNSVTDNPLVFVKDHEVVSGGNFHGQAIAMCMDYLAMGLAEICSMAERRVEKMMNPHFSDLPPFLIKDSGLNSGLMIAHVTLASLVSENKILCHPASVDSVPTSTDKEDHVSMGVTAGRKLREIIFNTKTALAIEFLCNSQGLDLLRPLKSSPALEAVHTLIRQHVKPIFKDRVFSDDIEKLSELVEHGSILKTVEKICSPLN
jgi:histidine ammonia-lyase